MPMLTARITDDEMARLKELAAIQGVSATSLIRKWIETPPLPGAAIDHAACDARIAELEDRAVPPSTHEMVRTTLNRPAFLAAPNDDCATCGHDRQSWHLGPKCLFRVGRFPQTCDCPEFVEVMFDD